MGFPFQLASFAAPPHFPLAVHPPRGTQVAAFLHNQLAVILCLGRSSIHFLSGRLPQAPRQPSPLCLRLTLLCQPPCLRPILQSRPLCLQTLLRRLNLGQLQHRSLFATHILPSRIRCIYILLFHAFDCLTFHTETRKLFSLVGFILWEYYQPVNNQICNLAFDVCGRIRDL